MIYVLTVLYDETLRIISVDTDFDRLLHNSEKEITEAEDTHCFVEIGVWEAGNYIKTLTKKVVWE